MCIDKKKKNSKFLADCFNSPTSSRKTKKANARAGAVSKTGQKDIMSGRHRDGGLAPATVCE